MGGRSTIALLVAFCLYCWIAGASYAELTVTGTKDFQYRSFSVQGSLNQFLNDYPTFMTDRGFSQSLRLNVTGTLGDNIHVDAQLDDTYDIEKDRKLLVRVDGKSFTFSAGRLTLELPQTHYLLFNKKALALAGTYRKGRHELTIVAGRPEGESHRDLFKGGGTQQEYIVTNRPVVQGSEIVQLDSRLLVRGTDYEFDYEEGTLVLNRKILPIESTSKIMVEYESTSTGTGYKSTVIGFREKYTFPARKERSLPASKTTPWGGPGRAGPCPGAPPGAGKEAPRSAASLPGATTRPTSTWDQEAPPPAKRHRSRTGMTEERIGIGAVVSSDQDSTSSTVPATHTPQRLAVVGTDIVYEVLPGWRLIGEAAGSFRNTNLRVSDAPVVKGAAYDFSLDHSSPKLDLKLSQQYLGPDFEAVGKTEFVRVGESNDLQSNVRLTSLNTRLNLTRKLFLDSNGQLSTSNLDEREGVIARDFVGYGNVLTWAFAPEAKLVLRERDETDHFGLPSTSKLDGSHRVRAGALTFPVLKKMVGQLRAEVSSDRGAILPQSTSISTSTLTASSGTSSQLGDTATLAFSLGNATSKRFKWNVNAQNLSFQDVDKNPIREALTLSGFTDFAFSRSTSASLSLIDRREKDETTGQTTTIDTGEIRTRYQPSDRLTVNMKASAEERTRILRVNTTDSRLQLLPTPTTQSLTVTTDQPVLTMNLSDTIDFRPSKRWDHRLSYRQRIEREIGTGTVLGSNRSSGYRLKYAPGQVFRTTTEVEKGYASSVTANLDRDNWLLNEELMWSLANGLNLSLTFSDSESKDRHGSLHERTTIQSVSAERTLGRHFTGLTKLARTKRLQGGETTEDSISGGIRYSPPKLKLRLQLDVEAGNVEGTDATGQKISTTNRKGGGKGDGQPAKGINLETALNLVKAGPNARGDTGYDALTLESKVFIEF